MGIQREIESGATFTEYMMVIALIGLLVFTMGPLLLGSAKSLYSQNQGSFNTADAEPFYNPAATKVPGAGSGQGNSSSIQSGGAPN